MKTPGLLRSFIRAWKLYVILGRMQWFSFHPQVQLILEQIMYITVALINLQFTL